MRRLVAVMAADMVGYTALMRRSEAAALGRLRSLREQFFEPIVIGHGGEILKRLGDGWIVAFPSIAKAAQAAMAVQTGLAKQSEAELRLGLHLGDLVESEADWHGDCINVAARLQGSAESGGLLVSGDFLRLLDSETASRFEGVGALGLKGLDIEMQAYAWRPPREELAPSAGVPRMRLAQAVVQPRGDEELQVLADEMLASIEFRLSRRTGVQLVRGDSEADYLLESRVRRSGARLRASLSLVWTAKSETVWSAAVDGHGEDPLDWIDRATDRADGELRFQINAHDSRRLAGLEADTLDVHGLLTLAAAHFYELTEEGYRAGAELCGRAITLEPENAMALAMKAEAEIMLAWMLDDRMTDGMAAEAGGMAERAVQLAPESDYAHAVLSLFHSGVSRDYAAAAASAARSLEISPGYCYAHEALALAALCEGRLDDARKAVRRAAEFGGSDSYLPRFLYVRAVIEVLDGQFEDAGRSTAEAISRAPGVAAFLRLRHAILRQLGRGEARREAMPTEASAAPTPLAALPPLPPALRARLESFLSGTPPR